MNCNEKIYYVYVENGKAVITEEKPILTSFTIT